MTPIHGTHWAIWSVTPVRQALLGKHSKRTDSKPTFKSEDSGPLASRIKSKSSASLDWIPLHPFPCIALLFGFCWERQLTRMGQLPDLRLTVNDYHTCNLIGCGEIVRLVQSHGLIRVRYHISEDLALCQHRMNRNPMGNIPKTALYHVIEVPYHRWWEPCPSERGREDKGIDGRLTAVSTSGWSGLLLLLIASWDCRIW